MSHRQARRARGSVSVELALAAPVLLLVLLLVVAAGRIAAARAEVDGAARDAARAATLARSPAAAQAAANAAATAALSRCQEVTVSADTRAWRPGGWVTVTVACTISLADLVLLQLPGRQTLTGRFTHPIDVYRGVSRGFVP